MAEGTLYYSFTVNSIIYGYHIYKDIWESPTIGEELFCEREIGNPKDPLTVGCHENYWRRKTPLSATFHE